MIVMVVVMIVMMVEVVMVLCGSLSQYQSFLVLSQLCLALVSKRSAEKSHPERSGTEHREVAPRAVWH